MDVTVPPVLSTAPPLSVSPTKPDAPAVKSCRASVTVTFVVASVPPYVTWKPVVLNVPPPKPATVALAPIAGSNDKSYKLVATQKPDAKDGYHFGTVLLKTTSKQFPELRISVRGMVTAP